MCINAVAVAAAVCCPLVVSSSSSGDGYDGGHGNAHHDQIINKSSLNYKRFCEIFSHTHTDDLWTNE